MQTASIHKNSHQVDLMAGARETSPEAVRQSLSAVTKRVRLGRSVDGKMMSCRLFRRKTGFLYISMNIANHMFNLGRGPSAGNNELA